MNRLLFGPDPASRRELLGTQVRRLWQQADANLVRFCAVLLSLDLFFIGVFAIHRIHKFLYDDNAPALGPEWDIELDRSYAEVFGYVKTAVVASVLLSIRRKWQRPIYLAFGLIFTLVLLDDALKLHERAGSALAETFAMEAFAGLRARALSELIVWTASGLFLCAGAFAAFVRSPQEDRGNGLLLMGALAVLGLFAVVIDGVHAMVKRGFRGADPLFTVAEDGGEQITLSLICGLALLIHREVRSRERGQAGNDDL